MNRKTEEYEALKVKIGELKSEVGEIALEGAADACTVFMAIS